MKRKLYQEIASRIVAIQNCIKTNNKEWELNHAEVLEKLIDELPHGSGINGKTEIDEERSNDKKIIIYSYYDFMNENGMYDGGTNFEIIVSPSFDDINLKINGRFGKYQDVKDYLYDVFYNALIEEIETNDFI
jgi:hypothetical protein